MISRRSFSCFLFVFGFLYSASLVSAGDIVHHDDSLPQRPGCNNNFVLVRKLFESALILLLALTSFLRVPLDDFHLLV